MKLADYMNAHGLTPADLRKMLGIKGKSTVQRYISGERVPSREMLKRIEQLTHGQVTQEDFLDPAPPHCQKIVTDRYGDTHTVYPWTNLEKDWQWLPVQELPIPSPPTTLEQPSTKAHGTDEPSKPVQLALDALGNRVTPAKRGGFLLDGRLVGLAKIVEKANEVRQRYGLAPIPYPGVHPIPDGDE